MKAADEFFEQLRVQLKEQLPFVAFRDSGNTLMPVKAILQPDSGIHKTCSFTESGFVFAPFNDKDDAIFIPAEGSEIMETSFGDSDNGMAAGDIEELQESFSDKKNQHIKLVEKGLRAIENHLFKKVVLSRKELIELKDPDPVIIFQKLLKRYSSAFVYLWYHPKIGLWLGATPETLLKVERNQFRTMSLAGTQSFEGKMDVVWGEKEKEEQRLVTDSILENLFEVPVANIEISLPYTARAGNLLHLRTDISGKLISKFQIPNSKGKGSLAEEEIGNRSPETLNLKHLITAIHPTPAVCGLPRDSAKEFILKNEFYNREFYTGFLGEINMKQTLKRSSNMKNHENQAYASVVRKTSLFVNLRCMKIEENKAFLFVGGGITKDSNPEAEWIETKNKAQTMKAVLLK